MIRVISLRFSLIIEPPRDASRFEVLSQVNIFNKKHIGLDTWESGFEAAGMNACVYKQCTCKNGQKSGYPSMVEIHNC